VALALLALLWPQAAAGVDVVDYQSHLGRGFRKRLRPDTRFIVVHSTECLLESALRTLSRGKTRRGRVVTHGGHANYLVARKGTIYRILDPRYRADHAGLSLWNGIDDLSDHSLGVELEGFHDEPFTDAQYRSLRWLLDVLKRRFKVASRDVLEHARVAYTRPNRFYARNWRGRKLDPGIDNFDRARAGLDDEYTMDPDVIAGRVGGDRELRRAVVRLAATTAPGATTTPPGHRVRAAMITAEQTAWSIAGAAYRAPTTLYLFPDGRGVPADRMSDWSDLPPGTEIYLDLAESPGVLQAGQTAWSLVQGAYDAATTLYLFPDGTARRGDEIVDWSDLASGTAVYVDVPEQAAP